MRFIDRSAPAPFMDGMVGKVGGRLSDTWQFWVERVVASLHAVPSVLRLVALEEQNASISATDLPDMILEAGVYRLSYYARITTAAGVSSSLTVTFAWTDGGVAQTYSGAAINGNTTTSYQSGSIIIRTDAGEDVTYATTYASNAAGAMKYSLDVFIEKVRE
ncbi:MAG: hypothetical protein VW405_06005 [Rhodospirillaceae bacterium]